jgi:hypothetical protein
MISYKLEKFNLIRQDLLTRFDQMRLPFCWQWAPLTQRCKNKREPLDTQFNDYRATGLLTTLVRLITRR